MRILLIIILFCSTVVGNAQHAPVISQYMHHALPLNPSFAGSADALSMSGSYRNQWTGMPGAPVTQTVSAHAPLKDQRLAWGAVISHDAFGVSRQTLISGMMAYRITTRNGILSFALSTGVRTGTNRWSEVITEEAGDQLFEGGDDQFTLPEFGTGLYYRTPKWYVSVSAPSLTHQSYVAGAGYRVEIDPQQVPVYLNTGAQFEISKDIAIRPSVMLRQNAARFTQLDLNMLLTWRSLIEVGAGYRSNGAAIGLIRMQMNEQFSLAYAYDHWFSDIASYQSGSHELTLRYDLVYHKAVNNPRFF